MTEIRTPERSSQQRTDALARANAVRAYRKYLKHDLKAGRRRFEDIVRQVPEEVATMKVVDLMLHIPSIGRVKANHAMRVLGISPSKTIGGLSPRQRAALLARVGR